MYCTPTGAELAQAQGGLRNHGHEPRGLILVLSVIAHADEFFVIGNPTRDICIHAFFSKFAGHTALQMQQDFHCSSCTAALLVQVLLP